MRIRRVIAVVGSVAFATLALAAGALATGSDPRAATVPSGETCKQMVTLADMKGASGIGSLEKGYTEAWKQADDQRWTIGLTGGTGSLPGTACYFQTKVPDTAYVQQNFLENEVLLGYVVTGYGQSDKEWNKYVAYRSANGGSQAPNLWIPSEALNGHGRKENLKLGLGSQAFALDFDLVASGEAEPVSYPQFPTHFYVVTVHTKHDDVLTAAVYGATLKKTEGLVKGILARDPKF